MNEWFNKWMHKGWALPALGLRPSMIYCALNFLSNTLSVLHVDWNVGLCLWGRHNSHLVPRRIDLGDEILNKLYPRNHIRCVWLIHLPPDTVHKWNYLWNPVWKDALLCDKCPVNSSTTQPPILICPCLASADPSFFWQKAPVRRGWILNYR
jgi:hypothetical protein